MSSRPSVLTSDVPLSMTNDTSGVRVSEPQIIFTGPSGRGWHRLQQAAECLQKYAYTYGTSPGKKDGIVDHDAEMRRPALVKGSLMHLALAQHYARIYQVQQGADPEAFAAPEDAVCFLADAQGTPEYKDLICSIYKAYARRYADDVSRMKVLGVERLFEARVRGKYLFTGRLDLLYADEVGRTWVTDHKTTSRLTAAHKRYYAASGQLIGYPYLARQNGYDVAGMKLNLIQVSEDPKFERITCPRGPHFEQHFEQTVEDIEESIARMQASGRPLDEWPKAMNELTCYHRYGACKFLDRCRWGPEHGVAGNWAWSD